MLSIFVTEHSFPPHVSAVVVGNGEGGLLGRHVRTMKETGPKVILGEREVHLRLHPTALQLDGEGWAIRNLERRKPQSPNKVQQCKAIISGASSLPLVQVHTP